MIQTKSRKVFFRNCNWILFQHIRRFQLSLQIQRGHYLNRHYYTWWTAFQIQIYLQCSDVKQAFVFRIGWGWDACVGTWSYCTSAHNSSCSGMGRGPSRHFLHKLVTWYQLYISRLKSPPLFQAHFTTWEGRLGLQHTLLLSPLRTGYTNRSRTRMDILV